MYVLMKFWFFRTCENDLKNITYENQEKNCRKMSESWKFPLEKN